MNLQFGMINTVLEKSLLYFFLLYCPQILVDFQNQGQILSLLVLTFSKHPLQVQFEYSIGLFWVCPEVKLGSALGTLWPKKVKQTIVLNTALSITQWHLGVHDLNSNRK